MANLLYLILYVVRLATHWLKLAIYYLYGALVFVAQPGARYLIPAVLIGSAYWWNAQITGSAAFYEASRYLFAWFPEFVMFLREIDPWLIAPHGFLCTVTLLLSANVWLVSPLMQRLIATFPAMRRPLRPNLRWIPPKHVIRTARARQVVPKLKSRHWNGDHSRLIERMPKPVVALLAVSGPVNRPPPMIDVTPPREPEHGVAKPSEVQETPSSVLQGEDGSVRQGGGKSVMA